LPAKIQPAITSFSASEFPWQLVLSGNAGEGLGTVLSHKAHEDCPILRLSMFDFCNLMFLVMIFFRLAMRAVLIV